MRCADIDGQTAGCGLLSSPQTHTLALLAIDSAYMWWLPWSLSLAFVRFFWLYVRARMRRK